MQRIHFLLAIGFAATIVLSGSTFSQAPNVDHLFVGSTFRVVMPEGGRAAERDSLLEIYHKQVTEKNPLILSQRVMQHFYGHDSHDMVIVTSTRPGRILMQPTTRTTSSLRNTGRTSLRAASTIGC